MHVNSINLSCTVQGLLLFWHVAEKTPNILKNLHILGPSHRTTIKTKMMMMLVVMMMVMTVISTMGRRRPLYQVLVVKNVLLHSGRKVTTD
jgi:accessory gene regulator protein AgrB